MSKIYLGLDVHVASTVWYLVDETGQVMEHGKVPTTEPGLTGLVARCQEHGGELVAAQESGKLSYFVHDVLSSLGVEILSFNPYHLQVIAASRKKTDKRDAYWIARTLQTGLTPHPVYIPTGHVRRLRNLLSRREAVAREQRRWLLRARAHLEAAGYKVPRKKRVPKLIEAVMSQQDGMDTYLDEALQQCRRMQDVLLSELKQVDAAISEETDSIDAIARLKTIPAVGDRVAVMLYAWVGDISRFPDARSLAAYVGLVPSVHQSGNSEHHGGITKQGSPQLRRVLVQAGHILLWRCRSEQAAPLVAVARRVYTTRKRNKIAVVAAARHILRIAFYVLRDGTTYDHTRLAAVCSPEEAEALSA